MKILLAADGSEFTQRAARYLARHLGELATAPEIHLLNVHAPLPYARAAAVVGSDVVREYHREECEKALAVAETELQAAGIAFQASWTTGDVAAQIIAYAESKGIDLIVMGSRGLGALGRIALGSVTDAVLRAGKCPVLVIR